MKNIYLTYSMAFFITLLLLTSISYGQNLLVSNQDSLKLGKYNDASPKSPWEAVLRSAILPGWGQHYNERKLKPYIIFGLQAGFITAAALEDKWTWENFDKSNEPTNSDSKILYLNRYDYHKNRKDLFVWWSALIYLYNLADAYVDAHLFDFDEESKGEPHIGVGTNVYNRKTFIYIRY